MINGQNLRRPMNWRYARYLWINKATFGDKWWYYMNSEYCFQFSKWTRFSIYVCVIVFTAHLYRFAADKDLMTSQKSLLKVKLFLPVYCFAPKQKTSNVSRVRFTWFLKILLRNRQLLLFFLHFKNENWRFDVQVN